MEDQKLMWKTLSSTYLFKDTWLTARKDRCERQDGKIIDPYYVFEFPEWVTCLAITEDNKILLVKQYRHALGEVCIELPGGCVDATDANTEEAIKRELLEETGYLFQQFTYLGRTSANPSTNANVLQMYVATGGKKVKKQALDENEEIEIITYTIHEFIQLLQTQKMVQSMHITTIFYALLQLGLLQFTPENMVR